MAGKLLDSHGVESLLHDDGSHWGRSAIRHAAGGWPAWGKCWSPCSSSFEVDGHAAVDPGPSSPEDPWAEAARHLIRAATIAGNAGADYQDPRRKLQELLESFLPELNTYLQDREFLLRLFKAALRDILEDMGWAWRFTSGRQWLADRMAMAAASTEGRFHLSSCVAWMDIQEAVGDSPSEVEQEHGRAPIPEGGEGPQIPWMGCRWTSSI